MLADCIFNSSISRYVCSNFPKTVNAPWKRAVARNFGLLRVWWFGVINLESTGLSRLPLTAWVDQSLDNYRRWKPWFYPSESVLTPTEDKHFRNAFRGKFLYSASSLVPKPSTCCHEWEGIWNEPNSARRHGIHTLFANIPKSSTTGTRKSNFVFGRLCMFWPTSSFWKRRIILTCK